MLTSVILIVLMLLLSAFFSGMEIAFTSKNRLKLEIDRKQSRMFDRIADIFSRHPGQYITTILVGNNIALVIYSLYMSLLLRGIFYALGWESIARNGSVAIETAVSTVIIIFFAEFLPKSVFRNNPNFYYRALAPVIYFFYLLLYPIARLTTLISHGILRLTGRRVEERTTTHSFDREDLASLLDTNSSEPRPEPDNELKLFQNALDFADLRVRDCMVPRVDVEAVDIDDTTIEQLTARFVDSKYSRIFVWRKSIDNIIGYINSKSLFTRPAGISDVMMQVNFVPETMPLQLVLQNFIKHRTNIAVVIDEFGGTAGVISLEEHSFPTRRSSDLRRPRCGDALRQHDVGNRDLIGDVRVLEQQRQHLVERLRIGLDRDDAFRVDFVRIKEKILGLLFDFVHEIGRASCRERV